MASNRIPDDAQVDAALERVSRGDTAAFAVIVRRHERSLRTWLAVHTPPGVDVDDIAQRSFVAAFTRFHEFELGTNFEAWLFTIAKFQLRTETTRLRRIADYHTRYGPDLLQRELARRSDSSSEAWKLRLEYLQGCLEALDERLRRFVSWRYDEEISLDEMATRSGRSVPAVKKQLWKARQLLHQCVKSRMTASEGGAS
ncbi:sigma-70 family RNA polymerase sigma factor [Thalassoglobus polymorphus]|nr:sigma-70 family RNA polymerase sigma factor [Thalassoglobus polymorphus]